MPPSKAAIAKRNQLTLTQLASYDDILTDALIDHVSSAWAIHPASI
jgi:histone-lysine N-methyltransferase SUV420H